MKAYLIDPVAKTITQAEWNPQNLQTVYSLIQADIFDMVRINKEGDQLMVDDNGLLKPNRFFKILTYPQPLAGRALCVGVDTAGESTEPQCTLQWLKDRVVWELEVA